MTKSYNATSNKSLSIKSWQPHIDKTLCAPKF